MYITLTRTGGFTGIPFKKTIDTSQLPSPEAKKIERLIEVNNPIPTEREPKGAKPGDEGHPDRFTYTLSIGDGATAHIITLREESLSQEMKELIHTIEET